MEIALDNRKLLVKMVNEMNDSDMLQVLAYAAGYEAGKTCKMSFDSVGLRNTLGQDARLNSY